MLLMLELEEAQLVGREVSRISCLPVVEEEGLDSVLVI